MKKFLNEFKEFAMKGNVVDMAVGVIIGAAFGKIVTSLVNDIIMPAIGMLTGGVNFSDHKWVIQQAQTVGEEIVTSEDEMRGAGIEARSFLKVRFPLFTSKVNYRNHRKIVVIDGRVAYTGGMNIALRYMKGFPWGIWRDTHIKIEGKAVYGLQTAFLTDWYVVRSEEHTSGTPGHLA